MTTPQTRFIAEPGSLAATTIAVIDAPREAVYRAHTEPELLARWWSPAELEARIERLDAKPGGSWRIINVDADGNEYAFRGVFHDVTPERIIQTFEFEAMPGHVCLQTATLEDVDGKTKVTQLAVFQTVEDRDGMKDTGMEAHAPVAMAQLAAVAKSL